MRGFSGPILLDESRRPGAESRLYRNVCKPPCETPDRTLRVQPLQIVTNEAVNQVIVIIWQPGSADDRFPRTLRVRALRRGVHDIRCERSVQAAGSNSSRD